MWACSLCDYTSFTAMHVKYHIARVHILKDGYRENAINAILLRFEFGSFYSPNVIKYTTNQDHPKHITGLTTSTVESSYPNNYLTIHNNTPSDDDSKSSQMNGKSCQEAITEIMNKYTADLEHQRYVIL